MAEQHFSAPRRAKSARSHRFHRPLHRSRNGVGHVAERHPEQFTVVGNHLAQHPEMSLTAIGLATHIQSLPEGTPVGIKALAAKFPEGETKIAAALRELEAHGYLARIKERTSTGRIVTRTISYNQPHLNPAFRGTTPTPAPLRPEAAPELEEPEPAGSVAETTAAAKPKPHAAEAVEGPPRTATVPEPHRAPLPTPRIPAHASPYEHTATTLLAALRSDDPRLLLSARDIHRLTCGRLRLAGTRHRPRRRTARPDRTPARGPDEPRRNPGPPPHRTAPVATSRRTRRAEPDPAPGTVPNLRRLRTRLPRHGAGPLPRLRPACHCRRVAPYDTHAPPRRTSPAPGWYTSCTLEIWP